MLRVIDLFAGCGGLSLGFQNAGFDIAAAFDNWDPAIRVYGLNFEHPITKMDLGDGVDIQHLARSNPEVIIGGPPCQDFSSAGWRDETLGRADLTRSFAKIVAQLKPQFFVMENVDRIRGSRALRAAIEIFRAAGYGLTCELLDASRCGAPQIRKRFFTIGELRGEDHFLSPYLIGLMRDRAMTIREYLGDGLGIQYYYRHPWSYKRRAIFSIDEPSPTIRGVNRPVPGGYSGHSRDAAPITPDIRPLTTLERALIQTFPPTFKWTGSKTDLEQLIGNAVPVKLAEYVANCLRLYCVDKEMFAEANSIRLTGSEQ